jgi:ParB-like chromosome segregation protein Spo0J
MGKSSERTAISGRSASRIEVRWLPVEALKPDKRNARLHSAKQIARIADSIAAFGFNVPVLVGDEGGILAGHGRALAAKRLGLTQVPTIAVGHLDEAQRRAFMIADNRLAELASWDKRRLGVELEELKSLDLDFSLSATGFELREIDLGIEAAHPVGAVDDRVSRGRRPRLKGPPVARAGDKWRLGPHRLLCGDDSEAAALLAVDAAIRQWQAEAGEGATLESTGETFDAVARAGHPSK